MHVNDIFRSRRPSISFEFFPPKNETASQELFQTIQDLFSYGPSFMSITYGAGGTTRNLTQDLVLKLHKQTQHTIIPHLTCIGQSVGEIHQMLELYQEMGIENLMVLRGDPVKGQTQFVAHKDGFKYAAQCVAYIKKFFPKLGVGIAAFPEGHPETPNRLQEIDYLKAKVDAGADYICTQMFFDNYHFYNFQEQCALKNINIPIVAGLMPVTGLNNLKRMGQLALGTSFPAKLLKAIGRVQDDDESIQKVGIHWATQQVLDLLDHDVQGIHFYTLNKSHGTKSIYESLGIKNFQDSLSSKEQMQLAFWPK